MSTRSSASPATAFFLAMAQGNRFCLYHAPHPGSPCRGGFVYVPPFAEEMNRARRMATLQARALAQQGFGVLQIDLFGCGDSAGEFEQATWELWKADLQHAQQWLQAQLQMPVGLWGLRLGALLAAEGAQMQSVTTSALLLWNPVLNGRTFLTQFLRLRLASELSEREAGASPLQTNDLRALLQAGQTLEIAGYPLNPTLAMTIDRLDASRLAPVKVPVVWLELLRDADSALLPAQLQIVEQWRQQQVALELQLLNGPAFWNTPEITTSEQLIEMTCTAALASSASTQAEAR